VLISQEDSDIATVTPSKLYTLLPLEKAMTTGKRD
jgi:hypothetical protein